MRNLSTLFRSVRLTLALVVLIITGKDALSQDLIVNGDFSDEDLANPSDMSPFFDTEYTYSDRVTKEGTFAIGEFPMNHHKDFCTTIGGANGKMLIANSSNTGSLKVWAQRIKLEANTNYIFSFKAAFAVSSTINNKPNLLFGVYAECSRMGNDVTASSNCQFTTHTVYINSGKLTEIELSIRNLSMESGGNDIALDDISLIKAFPANSYPSISERVWRGYNTDWFSADNWGSCTLPTCGDDVIIPVMGASKHYPVIPAGTSIAQKIANVKSITIEAGAKLTLSDNSELQVCGDIINNGTIAGSSLSRVALTGITLQKIKGTIHNLKINKTNEVHTELNGNTSITESLILTSGIVNTLSHELVISNAASSGIIASSDKSYVIGNLRRSIAKSSGFVRNAGFENTPVVWSLTNDAAFIQHTTATAGYPSRTGSYHLVHYRRDRSYRVRTSQAITNLTNGNYVLKAWVRSSSSQIASLYATDFDKTNTAKKDSVNINGYSTYTQLSFQFEVTNNQCIIGFYSNSAAGQWITVDDVELTRIGAIDYQFPVGDEAGRYMPITMTMTSELVGVTSIVGTFNPSNISKGTGLPQTESARIFTEINQGGYWHLQPNQQPTSGTYDVSVNLPKAPYSPNPLTSVTLIKRGEKVDGKDSPWNNSPSVVSGTYGLQTTYKRINYNSFSEYALAASGPLILESPSTLAVEGLTLKTALNLGKVGLSWSVESEKHVVQYAVERSDDGNLFEEISTIKRNDANNLSYSTVDAYPVVGNNYYRIKSVDEDGNVVYSNIEKLYINSASSQSLAVYPNPNSGKIINISADFKGEAVITIQGTTKAETVLSTKVNFAESALSLNLPNIKEGIYIVTVTSATTSYKQKLIVK